MHRTFDTSPPRRHRTLDGQWEFVTDGDDEGLSAEWYEDFPADADRIAVPGAWNARAKYYDYEGVAWYRRRFHQPADAAAKLTFHGICHDATVWLDGERLGDHYSGFTPFSAVTDLGAGEHELVVRADAARGDDSIPKPGTDWFPYGGITREVVLEELPDVFVDDVRATYDLDGDRASVDVTVTVCNRAGETRATVGAAIEPARDAPVPGLGRAGSEQSATVPAGKSETRLSLSLDVDRWSRETPALYEVVATVGEDEHRERIGFRDVEVTDTDLVINGEPVSLRGVNRHEDHPEWGNAQPRRLQELDLDLIERGGFDTIRTSHYPNHPRFLDMCDERGVLVVEEIPYWQFDADRFGRDGVLERGKTMLGDLIDRDRHHPAVFAWSVTNECANEEDGVYDATEELVSLARRRDDRPVTFATNNFSAERGGEDPCLELVDFACLNDYPGWYTDGEWSDLVRHVRERYPELPILLSEFGAGAVAGERTRENQKWSEGYQAALLEDAVETFEATESVVGFTVWQYCDTRTEAGNWAGRPKTKNNKGIVDEYRRPKEAFTRLARLFDE